MKVELIALVLLLLWIVLGSSWLRWSPFWVLFVGTFTGAFAFAIPLEKIPLVVGTGFVSTLSKIGLLILLGSWIGSCMEGSGATLTIAKAFLQRMIHWPLHFVVGFIGYLISIPVFCDAAFVILNSLNEQLARKSKTPKIGLTVALSTGLFATHVLVPPTPGPLAAAANFQLSNLFLLFVWGAILALILTIIGAAYSYWVGSREKIIDTFELPIEEKPLLNTPNFPLAISPILIPMLLMALGSLPSTLEFISQALGWISKPVTALFVGALIGIWLLTQYSQTKLWEHAISTIKQAFPIVLITAMGGALGKVLQHLPLGEYLTAYTFPDSLGLLLPFLITAFLKTTQGSSTVAILTASAIVFPLLSNLGLDSEIGKVWGILAIGTGAMTVSHANDSYFWIVSQIGGISPKKALQTHTVATLIQGLIGIVILLATYQLLGK